MPPRIAILAAEPSGDLQAAALVGEIRRHLPQAEFCGVGGKHLRAEGVELFFDSSLWSAVGWMEALPRIPAGLITYYRLLAILKKRRPDLIILIDAPGIQMKVARHMKAAGLRTLYYFPPSAWNPTAERARKIHERVGAVATAFRFNYETYRRAGLEVAFFGHPLASMPRTPRHEACAELGLDPSQRYVALMPGSRTQEIRLLLPLFLDAARQLREHVPGCRFLLPAATAPAEAQIRGQLPVIPEWLHLLTGGARPALAASELALMASGTVSLEAALLGVPMVLAYRLNSFDFLVGRLLVQLGLLRFRWFGLPNLVLQEDVVPELLQVEATSARIAAEALDLLHGVGRERQLAGLARVSQSLGPTNAVERLGVFTASFAQGFDLETSLRAAGGNLTS